VSITSFWIAFGFLGQAMFSARFILQWVHSERVKRSVIPIGFWYFSIVGGAILLSYAIWREDPVFILGQSFGIVIYLRNLYLIHIDRARVDARPT
jgi:lipid-A-disaccharide synthase-like uncharacterized protein